MADIEAALLQLDDVIARGEVGVEADHQFHVAVARASRNMLFLQSLDALSSHIFACMSVARNLTLTHSRKRLVLVRDEHRCIVDAIGRGNEGEARLRMRLHIDNARGRVLSDSVEP